MVSRLPNHLLLVEDNPGDAWLVRHLLEEIAGPDLEVATVGDGEEALAYLRHSDPRFLDAAQPDLILLDLNLPLKNGREVLREIRQDPALRDLPVVILSSSDAEDDIRPCFDLKANGYVVKQPDLDDQMKALEAIHRRWFRAA